MENEEIKEILEALKPHNDIKEYPLYLNREQQDLLYDCITNLQQKDFENQKEIMKLKDKLEQQRKEYQDTYKDVRIEIKEKNEQITNLQQERDCLQRNYDDNEQAIQKLIKELKELQQEIEELREYKKNATRKHWQQKCAEHHVQEMIYKSRCEKAIEYMNNTFNITSIKEFYEHLDNIENILQGSDENER